MSKTEDWLDNPYRTIIEYCEVFAMHGGKVMTALEDLERRIKTSSNEVAAARIDKSIKFVKENYGAELKLKNYLIQGGIVENMKQNLKD